MQKIVINTDYGGFNITEKDFMEYKVRANITDKAFRMREIDRDDPILVQLVEELTEKNLQGALKVVSIPDDVEWEIDDYDGIESIHEKHRVWR
jgi:hypothetical protein